MAKKAGCGRLCRPQPAFLAYFLAGVGEASRRGGVCESSRGILRLRSALRASLRSGCLEGMEYSHCVLQWSFAHEPPQAPCLFGRLH